MAPGPPMSMKILFSEQAFMTLRDTYKHENMLNSRRTNRLPSFYPTKEIIVWLTQEVDTMWR